MTNIPIGFVVWLRTQQRRQDDIGALARRVSSGQISVYRPGDSRIVPPAEIRAVIGRAVGEFNRRSAQPAKRQPSNRKSATTRTGEPNREPRCKGCGGAGAKLTVRTSRGTEHWHGPCRDRARATQSARSAGGRPGGIHIASSR